MEIKCLYTLGAAELDTDAGDDIRTGCPLWMEVCVDRLIVRSFFVRLQADASVRIRRFLSEHFVGMAIEPSPFGEARRITVAVNGGLWEFPCQPDNWGVGELVTVDVDQTLCLADKGTEIGKVAEPPEEGRIKVWVETQWKNLLRRPEVARRRTRRRTHFEGDGI